MKETKITQFPIPSSTPVSTFEERVVANPAYYRAAREHLGIKTEMIREEYNADGYEYEAIVTPPLDKIPTLAVTVFGADAFKTRETFRYTRATPGRLGTGIANSEPVGGPLAGRSRLENRVTVSRVADGTPKIEYRTDFTIEVNVPFVGRRIEKSILKSIMKAADDLESVTEEFIAREPTPVAPRDSGTPDAGDFGTPDAGDSGTPDAGDSGTPDTGDSGTPDAGDSCTDCVFDFFEGFGMS